MNLCIQFSSSKDVMSTWVMNRVRTFFYKPRHPPRAPTPGQGTWTEINGSSVPERDAGVMK